MLFLSEFDRIDGNEVAFTTIVKSFIMGVRFDVVIDISGKKNLKVKVKKLSLSRFWS